MADSESTSPPRLMEALVLLGVPGFAYWLAYFYEVGYFWYFNLPPLLIEVTLTAVLSAFASMLVALGLAKLWFDAAQAASSWAPKALRWLVRILFGLSFLAGVLSTVGRMSWTVAFGLGAVLALFLLVLWYVPILANGLRVRRLTKTGIPTADAILMVGKANAVRETPKMSDDVLAAHIGRQGMSLLFALAVLTLVALFAGIRSAETQTRFMLSREPESRVVVRRYGNQYLLAKFDREVKSIAGEFVIGPMDEKTQLQFTYEPVGPLRPASK